ncbi:unnamed protein product [Leptosia nina]|uniref:Ribosomal protein L7Ae/L30e/S12e/Gadd45 domain-containing protein n=1 Tax=Leptosia nina TaxID=320188 RepID=A0AAV1K3K6_9NEOP
MEKVTASKIKKPMSKTKLKKTIKNVVCRPDPLNWLIASDEEACEVIQVLRKYSVVIPKFKKPHWNDIKCIPKEKRTKPPPIQKVEGLLFGLSECQDSIQESSCSGILIEATVNPKLLVEPIIDLCCTKSIPYLCMKDLRKTTAEAFGIPTSCLGLKNDCILDIQLVIQNIYKKHEIIHKSLPLANESTYNEEIPMDTVEPCNAVSISKEMCKENQCITYLYRSSKKERVFIPNGTQNQNATNKFSGQNFIKFEEDNKNMNKKAYKNMILKRVTSNPKRVKLKES